VRMAAMRYSRLIASAALLAALGASGLAASAAAGEVHGRVVAVKGDRLTLRLRDGKTLSVDIAQARAAHHTGILPPGGAVVVYGTRDAAGTFHVTSVGHTSPDSKFWSPDQ
jgi:ABC-type sugar transport system substrate-binding protein